MTYRGWLLLGVIGCGDAAVALPDGPIDAGPTRRYALASAGAELLLDYAQLAEVKRDRFAVTTFPYLLQTMRDPAAIPADWITGAGDRGGEQTIVAETGWLGTKLVARATRCVTAIDSNEALQLVWFDKLMANAERMELITWIANRDLLPAELMTDCPCDYDATWCGFLDAVRQSAGSDPNAQAAAEYGLKQFGAMGLRRSDGAVRTSFGARWQAARDLPWRGL